VPVSEAHRTIKQLAFDLEGGAVRRLTAPYGKCEITQAGMKLERFVFKCGDDASLHQ